MNAHPCTSDHEQSGWQLSEEAYACLEEVRAQLYLLRTLSMPREIGTVPEEPLPMSREVLSLCIDQLARKLDEAFCNCVWVPLWPASREEVPEAEPEPTPAPASDARTRAELRPVDWVLGVG